MIYPTTSRRAFRICNNGTLLPSLMSIRARRELRPRSSSRAANVDAAESTVYPLYLSELRDPAYLANGRPETRNGTTDGNGEKGKSRLNEKGTGESEGGGEGSEGWEGEDVRERRMVLRECLMRSFRGESSGGYCSVERAELLEYHAGGCAAPSPALYRTPRVAAGAFVYSICRNNRSHGQYAEIYRPYGTGGARPLYIRGSAQKCVFR